ncbi:MAG: ribosomal large subunit pseudouridine synthase, partial [Betaproteobacteria bacterium]|nr:ribosomal large subunit pseudouridine synthase [Betaproteobacteria bacterium]
MILARKPLNYNASSAADLLQLVLPAASAGQRLDQALSVLLPQFSRSRLAQWIRDRRVEVDGEPALPKTKVWGGEKVSVNPAADPASVAATAESIALDVVHEDAAVLVIAKPAGLVVHPGRGNWSGTLL